MTVMKNMFWVSLLAARITFCAYICVIFSVLSQWSPKAILAMMASDIFIQRPLKNNIS